MNEYGVYSIQHLLEQWNNKIQGEKIKTCIIENFKELFYFNKKTKSLCLLFLNKASYNEKIKLVNTIIIMKSFGHKCDFNTNNNSNNNNNFRSNNSNNLNNNQNQIQNPMENQFPIPLNNNYFK